MRLLLWLAAARTAPALAGGGAVRSLAGSATRPWLPRSSALEPVRVVGEAAADAAAARAAALCSAEPSILAELRAATLEAMPAAAHMVSGPSQGRLLALLVKLSGASRVLEIGCFVGYASHWLTSALPHNGELVTLERDVRCAELARSFFVRAGLIASPSDTGSADTGSADAESAGTRRVARIDLRMGQGQAAKPAKEQRFGLVFIDGDKRQLGC
ncbi:O-methyltransferase-domain-containing protein [Pavlovales sp. CCMP2436]|nr:O-methyltransferase-domain-containing protein [Pavlovales sp. CCMP2436]